MSRLPAPDSGWHESTEGDLDPDLAEEAGSSLDDWDESPAEARTTRMLRIVSFVVLVAILGTVIASVVFR